ncbi:MAG: hypothetical protein K0Q56_1507 [Sporolactobacillus laevolacticus]|jgi:hypothetical protein|nr:hypothetical protein [Sporolactobacillus laevolacticus]
MRLNHDCVRDILLFVEELPLNKIAFNKDVFNSPKLKKYSHDDVTYAAYQLKSAGYIEGIIMKASDVYQIKTISDLTWNGHQFLDNIRSETVWEKSKSKVAETVGSASVSIISQVAASFVKSMLGLG